jgi:hypothetical protein
VVKDNRGELKLLLCPFDWDAGWRKTWAFSGLTNENRRNFSRKLQPRNAVCEFALGGASLLQIEGKNNFEVHLRQF